MNGFDEEVFTANMGGKVKINPQKNINQDVWNKNINLTIMANGIKIKLELHNHPSKYNFFKNIVNCHWSRKSKTVYLFFFIKAKAISELQFEHRALLYSEG